MLNWEPIIQIQGTMKPKETRRVAGLVMNEEQAQKFDETHELNMAISRSGLGRFRVNVFQQRGECAMVIRRLGDTLPNHKDLGLPPVLPKLIMSKLGLILFVGGTGSGKSTFVNLMLRLFEPQSGAIRIDGQNILEVTQDSLRENISMIPQDPQLFHRSLMENIRYGRLDASDEEVVEAAKMAHAHDFILQTEMHYDSLVGERGVKLSGGQR